MVRLHRGNEKRLEGALRARRKGFVRSEEGSLIIFGLFLFILMLTIAGLGVDFMRFEAQRARLQATLDRAVLAAASMDQPLPPADVVLDYFDKSGLAHTINREDIVVNESPVSRRVDATASMEVNTTLLKFSGIDMLIAPAGGAAEESASVTEISLILDVSGSMTWGSANGQQKIQILRTAATQFVNILTCDPLKPNDSINCTVEGGKVGITIVPYAEQVLVDKYLFTRFNTTNEHTKSTCVTFEADDFLTTSITPDQLLQRTGHFDPWSSSRDNARNWTCKPNDSGRSWREITPIDGTAVSLRHRIQDLEAGGNTSIDLGMKWGAAFLDPALQPIISHLVSKKLIDTDYEGRPYDWTERGVKKVVVLMTDGVNTDQHYLFDGYRTGDSPVFRNLYMKNGKVKAGNKYSIYDALNDRYYWEDMKRWEDHAFGSGTYEECKWKKRFVSGSWEWYKDCWQEDEGEGAEQMDFVTLWQKKPWKWYDQWSWLPLHGNEHENGVKNGRLDDICDAAKDQEITIFTVGFEVTDASATVLRQCASSPAHAYNVQGLDLTAAFAAIAREISKLRLVN